MKCYISGSAVSIWSCVLELSIEGPTALQEWNTWLVDCFSKPVAYITHNAAWPPSEITGSILSESLSRTRKRLQFGCISWSYPVPAARWSCKVTCARCYRGASTVWPLLQLKQSPAPHTPNQPASAQQGEGCAAVAEAPTRAAGVLPTSHWSNSHRAVTLTSSGMLPLHTTGLLRSRFRSFPCTRVS